MKKITLEERRQTQLEMLQEIHDFCLSHDIKYSLAFGTLLGAIRHKGFIPWDDDVDIMMPLPDMLRFKQEFKSEKLKYCDVDTESHYDMSFSRIVNMETYARVGIFNKTYGINIDTYPIVAIPLKFEEQEMFFCEVQKLQAIRNKYRRRKYLVCKYLPFSTVPGFDKVMKEYRDCIVSNLEYGSTGAYYIVTLPLNQRKRVIYNVDIFSEGIQMVPFEGRNYSVIRMYDMFLKHTYGDYMQLPPEDQRHPYHGGRYYWK